MEEQSVREIIRATELPRKAATAALLLLAVFLFVAAIGQLKGLRYIGTGVPATNTITVTGEGEVFAVPDMATFSVTVRENAKDVKPAQEAATKKANAIVAYLKEAGIDEKDVKTTDYSVYPQYEWSQGVCPASGYCPPGKQILMGFQVSQTLTVKVRDTEKAGELLSGVGSRGASEVSGLSFTIDDEDALKAQAQGDAIEQARGKADALAKSLGVKLVRVVGFYENEGPMLYYGYGMGGAEERSQAMDVKLSAPQIPTGENKIISSVSVTYEVR